jgi:flagellar biosynthesis/type III secretory pathway protein FliH
MCVHTWRRRREKEGRDEGWEEGRERGKKGGRKETQTQRTERLSRWLHEKNTCHASMTKFQLQIPCKTERSTSL